MQNYNTQLKKGLLFWIALLFIDISNAQVFSVDTLMRNGERNNRVNLVYLSDGYTAAEITNYIGNATAINNALFLQTPFAQYKNFFNVYAIKVPSAQSGAVHPGTASDEGSSGGQPVANPTIYFNSTFDYFSIHRLLVPQNAGLVYSVLASNLPDFDQAFIIVNSPYYGGSGGNFATSSVHSSAAEIAIHEIGHSFANLADEYWAGDFYAAEKHNMTQNTNPATVRWANWYGLNNIGIYAHGSSGTAAVWFRPHQQCKMRYLGYPFCSVCIERFIDKVHLITNMADNYSPSSSSFVLSNYNPVNFSVAHIQTIPSTISINWYLNGSSTPFASGVDNVSIPYANWIVGNNTVRAELIDNTTLSKLYLPAIGYIENINWAVNNPVALPVKLLNFAGNVNARNQGNLYWQIESVDDLQKFELEKSKDGIVFNKIASLYKNGSTKSFSFTDDDLLNPESYYRLKIFNTNQSYFYSGIVLLKNALEKFDYKVYQQPGSHQYRLCCNINVAQPVKMVISDASGRQLVKKDFGNVNAQLNERIDLSKYPSGTYFMQLFIGTGQYSIKLIAN